LHLLAPYRLITALCLLFVFFVELSIVLERYLFKILIDWGTAFTAGTVSRDALQHVLLALLLSYALILIIRYAGKYIHLHLINQLDGMLIADLKRKFFNHLLRLSHRFHTTHRTGSLISRLSRGGRAIDAMTDAACSTSHRSRSS
jgi:ATP-binding cassette subfamily B protein